MGVEGSTSGESILREGCGDEVVEPFEIEDVSDSRRRCETEIRQVPDDSSSHSNAASVVPPRVSLEGLILKIRRSKLKIGKKIGEGSQAILYAAHYAPGNVDVVVKKFKASSGSVQHYDMQGQWPTELFKTPQVYVCQLIGYIEEPGTPAVSRTPDHGILPEEPKGRPISLVMYKYDGDLRRVINREWPFKSQVALNIITQLAMGMKLLHDQGVIHKDLKAENILVQKSEDNIPYALYIGDFENSLMNEGTAFWRPPEVFPALEERNSNLGCWKPLPFSKAGDVYSFGMVCYEILTGNIPFEGHLWSDYGFIPAGNRPELPEDLDVNLRDMILRCWHGDPNARPSFGDICLELRQQAEAIEDASTRSAVMSKFRLFDEFCREKSGPDEKVCELKQMMQSLAQEYGSETEFVRLGFELVVCIEQFVFHFGSLTSSFIDTPLLPFSKWLKRMWLCNAVMFKRHQFIAVLPSDISPTYKILKVVWELTSRINDGHEKSNWGEDDSMTQEEKIAALLAFKEEQERQIAIQRQGGSDSYQVRPLSRLKCLVQRATGYGLSFLGMAAYQ
ncbi:hypothetical protein M758_6G123800 [Ceratodon purpureus]|nr:hypothetical protein M758_6G123800 [Ceratodon purpureus]KAG0613710.1 hypothetical protein M758_6G123800 [Ceratodon purpureus]